MHDFESIKRQIQGRVELLDVVSVHASLKRRGRRWVGLCPFHSEKTPSFTVNPDLGLFKCFGCGKGGDIFSFVQLKENVPFIEAMRILADRAGVEIATRGRSGSNEPGRAQLAKVNDWAGRFFRSNLLDETVGRSARAYLQRRQVSDATMESFVLGLAPDAPGRLGQAAKRAGYDTSLLVAADLLRQSEDGRIYDTFRNRLMFPIRDPSGRVVGFGGRTLVDDRAKYINTRQTVLFDKGRGLYGIELARDTCVSGGRAIVVEGYMDCIAAHQAGFAETVASLGTAMTEMQVDLLRRYCAQIILLFDSDQAGEQAAERAILVALPRCVAVRIGHVPEGKDPSDLLARGGPEAFSDVLNRAVDALEFKWLKTLGRFDADSSDAGRREAILEFLRIVAAAFDTGAVDAIQRGLLVNQVARLLKTDPQEVHSLVARLRSKRGRGVPGQVTLPKAAPPTGEEQTAWRHVLEVLLNKPGALGAVGSLPDAEQIVDQRDRRIAKIVFERAEKLAEFGIADVLAGCQEPGDAERVAQLAQRGTGGNHEAKLRLACERIRRADRARQLDKSKRRFLGTTGDGEEAKEARATLETIQKGLKEGHPYVPRRLNRHKGVSPVGQVEPKS